MGVPFQILYTTDPLGRTGTLDGVTASTGLAEVAVGIAVKAGTVVARLVVAGRELDLARTAGDAGLSAGVTVHAHSRVRGGMEGGAAGSGGSGDGALGDADLVNKAVYGTDVSAEQKGSTYVLRVALADRHQDVTINMKAKDSAGLPLVVAYTRCGPADEKHYDWALRQNVKMSAGAIAVVDIEDHPNFVVVDVMARSVVTPQLLINSVGRIAKKGDELEAALTKADNY